VLTRLYDDARVWVYGDFTMTTASGELVMRTREASPLQGAGI